MLTATPMCSTADQLKLRPHRSCSKKISVLAMAIERLRHNTHVGDAGLLNCIHHSSKSPEGYIFISPNEDELVLRVSYFLMQFGGNFIDINRVISHKHPLFFINANDHA